MADALRNEVSIVLGGETRTMRATFAAIRAIEKDVGHGLTSIIARLGGAADLPITDAVVIVYHGLRGAGDSSLTVDQIGAMLEETGFDVALQAATEFLVQAMRGVSLGKSAEAISA